MLTVELLNNIDFKGIVRSNYPDDKCHSHFPFFIINRGMDTKHKECVMEIWKDVVGWEGLYQVSSKGRIKSLKYHGQDYEKIIKSDYQDAKGYKRVCLRKGKIIKGCKIHRLVAMAFIPNPNNLPQVNHKDENPANNCVENLEWCDNKYNCNYGSHGKHISNACKGKRVNRKDLSISIVQLSKNMECLNTYPSMSEAGRQTGICLSNIYFCCKNQNRTAGGFYWRYL